MGTFLFDRIVFGPVYSRRLGISLGINLLPNHCKLCNFNCIYCECGFTNEKEYKNAFFHERQKVFDILEAKLLEMKVEGKATDVITFAGNGEPTLHPDFAEIVSDTIFLRNKYFKQSRIAVLSNASTIHNTKTFNALKRIDQNILKLDSAFDETIKLHNRPRNEFHMKALVENLRKFKGDMIIQTMFVRGKYKEINIDNTTDTEVDAWLNLIKKINPKEVMVYTIERDTPSPGLVKVSEEKLREIGRKVEMLGIKAQVSA